MKWNEDGPQAPQGCPCQNRLDAKKLGSFIANNRREVGLTQKQLADMLYVSAALVSKWERGIGVPNVTLLPAISKALNITVQELVACELTLESTSVTLEGAEQLKPVRQQSGKIDANQKRKAAIAFSSITIALILELAIAFYRGIQVTDVWPAITTSLLMLSIGAWFCFLSPDALPEYYDHNRLSYVAQGPFRLHLIGLRIHNGNWKPICEAGRTAALALTVISIPIWTLINNASSLAPGITQTSFTLLILMGLFIPIYVAGKRNE